MILPLGTDEQVLRLVERTARGFSESSGSTPCVSCRMLMGEE